MRSSLSLRWSISLVCMALVSVEAVASAQEECPLGSTSKTENGATWCEPSVCDTDLPCGPGSVCRPVPLCVEVGTLAQKPGDKTDAGQRLLVRQRCGENKSCPQNTTCSEKSRCITRSQAERAGLLTPSAASGASSASAAAAGSAPDAPKKACGCHVPGTSGGERGGAALAMLGVLAIAIRRSRARTAASR